VTLRRTARYCWYSAEASLAAISPRSWRFAREGQPCEIVTPTLLVTSRRSPRPRVGRAVRGCTPARRWGRQAALTGWALPRGFVLLLRREHLAVMQQRFVHQRRQRLRAERNRQDK